jgi:hypothetical protein
MSAKIMKKQAERQLVTLSSLLKRNHATNLKTNYNKTANKPYYIQPIN